jgi:hypothetical protein
MVQAMGAWLFPDAAIARQMMMGVEVLHLIGNGLFLATIAGVYYFIPSKWLGSAGRFARERRVTRSFLTGEIVDLVFRPVRRATADQHVRHYPLTGHAADVAEPTRIGHVCDLPRRQTKGRY